MRDNANQRESRYPSWVCSDCGERFGRREPSNATWHDGECDVCGFTNAVTEPRDFGHLKDGWQLEDGRSMLRRECPNSVYAAGCELQDASRSLFLQVAYALKIDKVCDWLAKVLRRLSA